MSGNKKLWGPLHDHDLLRPIGDAVKVYGNVNNIKVLGQKQVQYFIPTFLDVNAIQSIVECRFDDDFVNFDNSRQSPSTTCYEMFLKSRQL